MTPTVSFSRNGVRKSTRRVLATAATAMAVLGLAATPAFAADWEVEPKGPITGTLHFGEGDLVIVRITGRKTGSEFSCDTGATSGDLFGAATGNVVAELDTFALSDATTVDGGCLYFPGPAEVEFFPLGPPWSFRATGQSGDTVSAQLAGVAFRFEIDTGCQATVGGRGGAPTGVVNASYSNSTGILTLHPADLSLEIVSTTFCDIQTVVGDDVSIEGPFDVRASGNVIPTITQVP